METKVSLQRQIGRNVKRIREMQSLSQDELSEKSGISKGFIAQVESGSKMFSVQTLCNVASTLHVSVDALIYGESDNVNANDLIRLFESMSDENAAKLKDTIYLIADKFCH